MGRIVGVDSRSMSGMIDGCRFVASAVVAEGRWWCGEKGGINRLEYCTVQYCRGRRAGQPHDRCRSSGLTCSERLDKGCGDWLAVAWLDVVLHGTWSTLLWSWLGTKED